MRLVAIHEWTVVNRSGFRRCGDDVFAVLGCYAACVGSCLPAFWTARVLYF